MIKSLNHELNVANTKDERSRQEFVAALRGHVLGNMAEHMRASYHNRYPVEWAKLNREAVQEAGREGDVVFFLRSGFTRSPAHATLFWEGDQMVTWDAQDGFMSALTGLISGGFSGFTLNRRSNVVKWCRIGIKDI